MGRRNRDDVDRRMPSWTGTGLVEVRRGAHERTTAWDVGVAVVLCLIIDVVAFVASIVFEQRTNTTVCGNLHCYDNPQPHIHDAVVTFIAYGVAAAGMIAASQLARRNRTTILVVQALVVALVVAHTLPKLRDAQHNQTVLKACEFGFKPPCGNLQDIGPR